MLRQTGVALPWTRRVVGTPSGSVVRGATRAWLVALLLIGGALVALRLVTSADPVAPEGQPSSPTPQGSSPTLDAHPGRRPSAPPVDVPTPAAESSAEALSRVLLSAPKGRPEEWSLARVGSHTPSVEWLSSVLSRIVQTTSIPRAPFQVQYVLGVSDREWLESLASHVERELGERRRRASPADSPSAAWDGLAAEMNVHLADIAYRRVTTQPALLAPFEDRRCLRDIEPGSPDAAWLAAMIEEVSNTHLWATPGLLTESDKALVAGDDLMYIRELSNELGTVWLGVINVEDRPRAMQETKGIVLRLYDRLAPRRR